MPNVARAPDRKYIHDGDEKFDERQESYARLESRRVCLYTSPSYSDGPDGRVSAVNEARKDDECPRRPPLTGLTR